MTDRPYGPKMDFNVLGPLRAVREGVEVEVRGAKERTLLAHLVAYAGQVVPTADLVDSLWGDDPPRSAAKSLQTYVLRLRNALEPDRAGEPRILVTAGGGYRLAITPRDTDAGRFAQLADLARQSLQGGRSQAALDACRDALELWRGPAYAGCEETAFGQAEARRLSELRLATIETRIEAMLTLGQEQAAAPELERLVGEHPLRERLWEMLMLADYRSGQQARALEAYDRVRDLLGEELGVDPGPGLRELHARVLAQDPGLDVARRRTDLPASLRLNGTPFVGRERELATLRDLWRRTVAGSTTTALVRGPAGAGATSLAAVLAQEVAGDGFAVVTDGAAPPAGPWLRVLDGSRAEPEPGALQVALGGPGATPVDGATVIDLAPLTTEEVRRVVAAYADPDLVDEMTADVLARGVAWPARVHADAARLAREAATRRLAAAVGVVGESSARLTSARADVSATIVTLGESGGEHPVEPGTCPWRGLATYEVADAAWFAGRERLVAELLSRLASTRLLAIVGASGSGKSSALRAGMLAALAQDVLPGSSTWRQVVMRPGRHPMRELARAAMGNHRADVSELLAQLIRAEGDTPRTLLVVDQMEEVWTACEDPGERAAFLDTLVELLADPRSSTAVVLAVRADYVGEAAEHADLAALMADGTVLVGSPTPAEVERAITRPAARAGLVLEDGLAATIVSDAGTEPGLLPLLSVALTQLWEHREQDRLTYAGYLAVGGITGAIGTLAEDVWDDLSLDDRTAARLLLLRLAGPGEGAGVVRRRVPLVEIEALAQPGLRRVVDRLAAARLVTVGDAHVEVAHEALFREWPRLRGWLTDDAAGRAVQRRLALAASEWDTEGREPTGLWRGTRLQSGLEVAAARPDEVTHVEEAFLEAGRAAAEAEEREVRERAESTARQNRRLRWLLVGLAVFLVLALVAGALAMAARGQAEDSAAAARESAVAADARRLAADALNEDRPSVALLQAVEAVRKEPAPETYGALLTLLTRTPEIITRFRIRERFLRIGVSADGSTVYLADSLRSLFALDALTGEQRWVAQNEDEAQFGQPVVDADGEFVAVPRLGEEQGLAILDPETGDVRHQVTMDDLREVAPDGSPWLDESVYQVGDRVAVTSESHLFLVSPETGRVVRATPIPPHSPFSVGMPDGRIWFDDNDGQAEPMVLDPRTGRRVVRDALLAGASPDGNRYLTARGEMSDDGVEEFTTLQLLDSRLRPVGDETRIPGYVRQAVFLPGGREIAVAGEETVDVYDARSLEQVRTLEGHSGAVLGVAVAGPDRDVLWTAGRDSTAVAYDLSGRRGVLRHVPLAVKAAIGEAAGGRAAVTPYYETEPNTLRFLDLERGRDLHGELQPVKGCPCQPGRTAITPDGRTALVAIIEFDEDFGFVTDRGRVVVMDVDSGTVRDTIDLPWDPAGLALSADGERLLVNGSGGWGLWEVATGDEIWRTESDLPVEWFPTGPLAGISRDGTRMAVTRGETVVTVDPGTGREIASKHLVGSRVAARPLYSEDGETLVVGTMSGHLSFLDADTLERVAPDRLVTAGFVLDAQLSPDGSVLAVMGTDGDVTLFDAASWKPYGKPVVDNLGWGFLTFTDADTLRVYGEFGHDVEISVDPDVWVETACRVANTEFTPEESALILPGQPVEPTCA
jgi:DNA-binding SARP family transcriptional activator/outer membrane protein assembly factor BamB